MEDRYLYRAKRIDNGEWVEGYLVYDNFDHEYRIVIELDYSTGTCFHTMMAPRVDSSTICKCTGKTDIENNLIFEHDIVSFLDATSTGNGYSESCQVGEVLYDDETVSFQVTERLSAESYEVLEDCKVLGNTIDNQGLLEVGE
ncbi:MAG: YopX family protein [Lachnospiraceae bacterium]|nr:YopX family protein [Lachnospiraceae bacterium]MDD7627825.1 YopX family protein [Lachnospiraceae bacterium]MDY4118783.1 YopX family protein [Lachnospiraceae bacterium]